MKTKFILILTAFIVFLLLSLNSEALVFGEFPDRFRPESWLNAHYLMLSGINANQNINISLYNFTTTGTGTFGALVVDTDTLVVDAVNHRVGIGTATPTQELDVIGDIRANSIMRTGSGDLTIGNTIYGVFYVGGTDSTSQMSAWANNFNFQWERSVGSSVAHHILFRGMIGDEEQKYFKIGGHWNATDPDHQTPYAQFYVNTSFDENVGIGTTSPLSKLYIKDDDQTTGASMFTLESDDGPSIKLNDTGEGHYWTINTGGAGTDIYFNYDGEGASGNKVFFGNDGKVGIGTTTPSVNLELGTSGGGNRQIRLQSDTAGVYSFWSQGSTGNFFYGTGASMFIGTTDEKHLLFVTNNTVRMKIDDDDGFVNITKDLYVEGTSYLEDADITGTLTFPSTSKALNITSDGSADSSLFDMYMTDSGVFESFYGIHISGVSDSTPLDFYPIFINMTTPTDNPFLQPIKIILNSTYSGGLATIAGPAVNIDVSADMGGGDITGMNIRSTASNLTGGGENMALILEARGAPSGQNWALLIREGDIVSLSGDLLFYEGKAEIGSATGGTARLWRYDDTIATGNVIGSLEFYGTGGQDVVSAKIDAVSGAIWGWGDIFTAPTMLKFYTTGLADASAQERMIIMYDGRVGINDSSPDALLEIAGSIDRFMISSVADNDGDIFIVKDTGDVGIGTITPQNKLNVIGDFNVTEDAIIGGDLNMSANNVTDVDCIVFASGGKICSGA